MWKRWWQGVGPCHRGRGKWYRVRPVAQIGTCCRVRGMWQGVGACGSGGGRVWGHVAGIGVCGRGSGL